MEEDCGHQEYKWTVVHVRQTCDQTAKYTQDYFSIIFNVKCICNVLHDRRWNVMFEEFCKYWGYFCLNSSTCRVHWWSHCIQQDSSPAWTQEAYCPLHGKHTLCYPGAGGYLPRWGVPTLVGGYLPWWGVPTLVGGTYPGGGYLPRWGGTYPGGGYLPWWGVPTLVGGTYPGGGGYLPWWGGTYPSGGVPTLVGGTYLGRYPPIQTWVGTLPPRPGKVGTPPHPYLRVGTPPTRTWEGRYPPIQTWE